MRILPFVISASATIGLVFALNTTLPSGNAKTPRLGYFLSPQHGFWQNAEPINQSFDADIKVPGIKTNVEVQFDERLVPHIYAENDADAYYVQGYLHAKFRLWQMEFQTHVAAGRLSEIVGVSRINTDKYFRRLGMVYGAEKALEEAQKDPRIKEALDAYTNGVNAYISSLKTKDIPLEYKLLDYQPELWNNLKTCLFLKFMSFDLTGQGDDDLYRSNAVAVLGYDKMKLLYPDVQDSLDPIVPKGTLFENPSITPIAPKDLETVYKKRKDSVTAMPPVVPDKDNGSNNWAVAGSKTRSGKPMLANDPHLGLNLPSLWYEIQISTPTHNTYGVSFPGSPAVIIGFNDSIAWGVTNAGRDVKDFYEIKFRDTSMMEYWLDSSWQKTTIRYEKIKINDGSIIEDKIAYTVFGPVMYDYSYKSSADSVKCYAVRWKAQDPSNELLTFYKLNRAKNYFDYIDAISTFECPGQNFVFASTSGDIAIKQQGKFVAKWKGQGELVMPGFDTTYQWQGFIPTKENPGQTNPERGFVSSANQEAVDTTYPYYLGNGDNFPLYRGISINQKLSAMNHITVEDMQALQTNNHNVFAETALPILFKYIDEYHLTKEEQLIFNIVQSWDKHNHPISKGATVFYLWIDSLEKATWGDEFAASKLPLKWPNSSTLIESIIKDSNYVFADDVRTINKKESIQEFVTISFKQAAKVAQQLDKEKKLAWAVFKDTRVSHLLKLEPLSRLHLNIGGGEHIINATKSTHGPSWRMIVHLTAIPEAFVVYPGGQSGNPGSKYYDSFIDTWVAGKYYPVIFLKKQDARRSDKMKWNMTFITG